MDEDETEISGIVMEIAMPLIRTIMIVIQTDQVVQAGAILQTQYHSIWMNSLIPI